ncbi:hypothetical protein F0P96_10640 [Hymenobacter busanensis]|uniref:Uncharacterized protein n=1 Tax=Hymenobacter busanensis TaxID=2607656 RepID=A0A7L5A0H2_9BACT|nr:hypothetical protein [Hymenobacter busanensis]KAA9333418.1 hypothetical protein F0P96_10640 [Hymenobacter busanensis]QHJ07902.1 hypothetical protein GUY19_11665 [Hymenobacter busanensis]
MAIPNLPDGIDAKLPFLVTDAPANKKISATQDWNPLAAGVKASIAALNTNVLEIPANYLPGFPGGTVLQLVAWVYQNAGGGNIEEPVTSKTITPTAFSRSMGTKAATANHAAYSELCDLHIAQTGGTSATVAFWSDMPTNPTGSNNMAFAPNNDGNVSPIGIAVEFDGEKVLVDGQPLALAEGIGLTTFTLPLPGDGTLTLKASILQNHNAAGVLSGAVPVSVTINGANVTAVQVFPARKPNGAVHWGDSRVGGVQTTNPAYTSLLAQEQALLSEWDIVADAAGGNRLSVLLATDEMQQAEAQRIATALQPYPGRKVLLHGPCDANDFGQTTVPSATLAALNGSYFDKLHALDPEIEIIHLTGPLGSEAGMAGETPDQFRAGLNAAATGRPFVKNHTLTGATTDGVHFSDAGAAVAAGQVAAKVNEGATEEPELVWQRVELKTGIPGLVLNGAWLDENDVSNVYPDGDGDGIALGFGKTGYAQYTHPAPIQGIRCYGPKFGNGAVYTGTVDGAHSQTGTEDNGELILKQLLYEVTGLTLGSHTLRMTKGAGDYFNLDYVEVQVPA